MGQQLALRNKTAAKLQWGQSMSFICWTLQFPSVLSSFLAPESHFLQPRLGLFFSQAPYKYCTRTEKPAARFAPSKVMFYFS